MHQLPNEVICEIITVLPLPTLLAVRNTSQHLRSLVDTSVRCDTLHENRLMLYELWRKIVVNYQAPTTPPPILHMSVVQKNDMKMRLLTPEELRAEFAKGSDIRAKYEDTPQDDNFLMWVDEWPAGKKRWYSLDMVFIKNTESGDISFDFFTPRGHLSKSGCLPSYNNSKGDRVNWCFGSDYFYHWNYIFTSMVEKKLEWAPRASVRGGSRRRAVRP